MASFAQPTDNTSTSLALTLRQHAAERGDEPFLINAADGTVLTYAGCVMRARRWMRLARRCGVGDGDRVATVVANSAELLEIKIAALLGRWTFAPLSPSWSSADLAKMIAALEPSLVIAEPSRRTGSPRLCADERIHWLGEPLPDPVGENEIVAAEPENGIALILHTSGTTGTQKRAAFTPAQAGAIADNAVRLYRLERQDRHLAVMPLCHVSGLQCALATLRVGGSIVVVDHFDPGKYWRYAAEYRCTWLPLVPAMIAQLLRSESEAPGSLKEHVRFVRSSSAPLQQRHRLDFEARFGLPIVEGMGCTEAGMVFSNPVPPEPRKPGTVGRALDFEVRAVDESSRAVARDEPGQLEIRGPALMSGYYHDPERTAATLSTDGWMRTGDRVSIDADGFVTFQSREGDVINRGGIKVAPREIEAVLMEFPGVADAAAVAMHDPVLGADIAAFVEAAADHRLNPTALSLHCLQQLGAMKAPRWIDVLERLPRNATGKVARDELKRLAANPRIPVDMPTLQDLQPAIRALWSTILSTPIDNDTNFFDAGGHSLLAIEMLARLRPAAGLDASLGTLYDHPTVERFAGALAQPGATQRAETASSGPGVLLLHPTPDPDSKPALFGVYGPARFRQLAAHIGDGIATYGVYTPREVAFLRGAATLADLPQSVEELAAEYVEQIRAARPHGPYSIVGFSFGGRVALEVARMLADAGEQVALLAVLDTYLHGSIRFRPLRWLTANLQRTLHQGPAFVWRAWDARRRRAGRTDAATHPIGQARARDARFRKALRAKHKPLPFTGNVVLFVASRSTEAYEFNVERSWRQLVGERLVVHELAFTHDGLLSRPGVEQVARLLRQHINAREAVSTQIRDGGVDARQVPAGL